MTDFKAEDNTGTVPVQDRHQVDLEALTAFMVTSVAGFQGGDVGCRFSRSYAD